MKTFIALIDFTAEGIKAFRNTAARAEQFQEMAAAHGITVEHVYWTLGDHDGVLIFQAPDAETAAAALLSLGSHGCVRSRTLQAFDREAISTVIAQAD